MTFDSYEGWIDNKQFTVISEEDYGTLKTEEPRMSSDLVDFITTSENHLLSICLGSNVQAATYLQDSFEGKWLSETFPKEHLIETALLYLNTPYL